jgi:hypothetical protein
MRDAQRTVFLHIPKTGGWWVLSALQRSLPEGTLYAVPSERVGDVPLSLLLARYATVVGHFSWRHLRPVMDDCFAFTFLRHPIERVLSLYYFYRRQAEAPNLDHWVARVQRSRDIDAFVDELPRHTSPWSNWQTFVLSGLRDGEHAPAAMLEAASRNMDRLDLVGVQDDLGGGLRALGQLRGWNVETPGERLNDTPGRPGMQSLQPRTLEKLQALNELDAALFAQARQRWAAHRAGFEAPSAPAASDNNEVQVLNESGTCEVIIDSVTIDPGLGHIVVEGHSLIDATDVTVGIRITNSAGLVIFGTNTRLLGQRLSVRPGNQVRAVFRLDLALVPDTYTVTAAIHEGADHILRCFHWIERAGHFVRPPQHGQAFSGLLDLGSSVEVTTR